MTYILLLLLTMPMTTIQCFEKNRRLLRAPRGMQLLNKSTIPPIKQQTEENYSEKITFIFAKDQKICIYGAESLELKKREDSLPNIIYDLCRISPELTIGVPLPLTSAIKLFGIPVITQKEEKKIIEDVINSHTYTHNEKVQILIEVKNFLRFIGCYDDIIDYIDNRLLMLPYKSPNNHLLIDQENDKKRKHMDS